MKCLLIELITVECHSTELPHSYIHHTSWLLITYNLKSIELNRASNQNYDSLWWLVLSAWPRRTIVRCHQKLSGALFASLTRTGHKSYDPQGLKIIVMLCVRARARSTGRRTIYAYFHGIDTDLMANNPSAMSISFISVSVASSLRIIPFVHTKTNAHITSDITA